MLGALRTDNSPFDERQLEALNRALETLEPHQSLWLSGYLAGLGSSRDAVAGPAQQPAPGETLHVFFASETGTGEGLAARLAETASAAGVSVVRENLGGWRPQRLAQVANAVFIVSTHGEGDPPEDAIDLFEALEGTRAPRLDGLRYRVLALGDRSYAQFCAAGIRLDERLAALGAQRIGARVDCDLEVGPPFEAWAAEVLAWSQDQLTGRAAPDAASARTPSTPQHLSVVRSAPRWTREHPFEAQVLERRSLTGEGSAKEVHHLVLSLADSGLGYVPGDALGVWAPNRSATVSELLERIGLAADHPVTVAGKRLPLRDALTEHRELTRLDPGTIEAWARAAKRADLHDAFSGLDAAARQAFLATRQFADLVAEWPGRTDAQSLVDSLRPLAPRAYSIASAADWVGEEVHLTVATVREETAQGERRGLASGHLNLDLEAGGTVRVFPEPNRRFRLPEDAAPLILIGAGTGIAPYRAFLQQLEAADRSNPVWLLFGNPHLRTDFLYQREWLRWRESGRVARIDAAWSRDQREKRYLQHLVAEQAGRLEEWLARGAHVYLCGALAMGKAVEAALGEVLARSGRQGAERAPEALTALRREGRLHRDLY